eukprot:CAMPEP_0206229058 /NCGR_PEP_ID=MMETSP0047_2-20121206/9493_1 /ASSEMBLY_ACC=CAM_ASM_000192 /TAXON_ID=195065 /ORGANISM="Chroomonas mesostigmatica_cf, Strain CCMP1168" /LENGTH=188 /DNA_ID=CAMNT_0053652329 /DNA_START=734 /DNA_END=1302 /DNA_ORIENTATION=-
MPQPLPQPVPPCASARPAAAPPTSPSDIALEHPLFASDPSLRRGFGGTDRFGGLAGVLLGGEERVGVLLQLVALARAVGEVPADLTRGSQEVIPLLSSATEVMPEAPRVRAWALGDLPQDLMQLLEALGALLRPPLKLLDSEMIVSKTFQFSSARSRLVFGAFGGSGAGGAGVGEGAFLAGVAVISSR